MMTSLYSVAFYPSEECQQAIREMQETLKEAIGWYPGAGADGQLTVNVFTADATQLENIMSYLEAFARKTKPEPVSVRSGGTHAQTLFLTPDDASATRLKEMMALLNKSFPVRAHKTYDPHISIARQLTADRLSQAKRLLSSEVKMDFECDRITLRKFDPYRQQYRRVKDFVFSSSPNGARQLSFFE
ncbi:MAG TPA: 2'-5' RNA ligase family protein [Flavobacterium sp.]|nr:2'-5' RNA ligase family protein [Flavobacterium sp.]